MFSFKDGLYGIDNATIVPIFKGQHHLNAQVCDWRASVRESLRTGHVLNNGEQDKFILNALLDPTIQMFNLVDDKTNKLMAFFGLNHIDQENRQAEISIIVSPEHTRKRIGTICVEWILYEGFNRLNLDFIYGECYDCNKGKPFWEKIAKKYSARTCIMPNRKYWDNDYHDAFYFCISKKEYELVWVFLEDLELDPTCNAT